MAYPATPPSFTPKVDGVDYPQAADINELQTELTAVGTALVSGTIEHDLTPQATADARALGSSSQRWGQAYVKGLTLGVATELTIASGVVTATPGYFSVDTESNAASDDLDTITPGTGLVEGSVVILRAENVARVVTLKDGSGNLLLNGDYVLSATDCQIALLYDGTNWRELSPRGSATAGITTSGSDVTQIKFATSQSASSNANTLDDYEEGTWNPTDASGASLGVSNSEGSYIKIGQLVWASGQLTYPGTGSGSNAVIGGFPFTVSNILSNSEVGASVRGTNGTANLFLEMINNTTTARFVDSTTGTPVVNNVVSTGTYHFTIVYRATA